MSMRVTACGEVDTQYREFYYVKKWEINSIQNNGVAVGKFVLDENMKIEDGTQCRAVFRIDDYSSETQRFDGYYEGEIVITHNDMTGKNTFISLGKLVEHRNGENTSLVMSKREVRPTLSQ